MIFGAMTGWLTVYDGGDLWMGLRRGGARRRRCFGLLHAVLTVPLGLSQHVTGLGITLLASSLTYFIYRLISRPRSTPPTIVAFPPVPIPVSRRPSRARRGAVQRRPRSPISPSRLVVGRRLRPQPHAARPRHPHRRREPAAAPRRRASSVVAIRIGAVIVGSALMALGGAFLTLSAFNTFFFEHDPGPRLGLHRARRLRLVATRQGAARRAPLRPLRRLPVPPPARRRRGVPYQVFLMTPLSALHRSPWW